MASNNFVALLGMFILYKTQIYLPVDTYQLYTRQFCAFRVVWRFFGFNSGCIGVVMATERWMALTRPFAYRKIVTQSMTTKTLIGFSVFAALLSVAPLIGFGAYFNETANTCQRYRDGTEPIDVVYAYTFFSFGKNNCKLKINFQKLLISSIFTGTLLIVWIVACNMSVTKTLYDAKWSRTFINPLITRSQEEIRFARLMTFLSISFVICWLPQMTCVIIAQNFSHWESFHKPFCKVADLLMVLHFIIDPYIYVLARCKQDQGSNDEGKKSSLGNSNTVQEVLLDTNNGVASA